MYLLFVKLNILCMNVMRLQEDFLFNVKSVFCFLFTIMACELTMMVVSSYCEKPKELVKQLLLDVINAGVMTLRTKRSVVLTLRLGIALPLATSW